MLTVGDPIDRYRVLEVVDRGEITAVVRAEHAHLGTVHAVKVMTDPSDPTLARAVVAATRLQARFDHPHLVRVTDGGVFRGHPYLVMEWMNGGSLADWLDAHGALPVPEALALFRGICRGVRALHALRVVHRDLKPSNVLLQEVAGARRRFPKVTDLGLAKQLVDGSPPAPSGLSAEFRTLGTPEYMAPEQSGDAGAVDRRADLWSLGILLYELLTNEVPFEAEESWKVLVAARLGAFRPVAELRPETPPAIGALVGQLLQPDPARRTTSCDDVLAVVDRALAGT